uniref:NR LBD domain-containing protein n=2 Tax=Caenorhabditis tropicalis TaxID=1561998 RepID=A0A1I7TGE9_9PELO
MSCRLEKCAKLFESLAKNRMMQLVSMRTTLFLTKRVNPGSKITIEELAKENISDKLLDGSVYTHEEQSLIEKLSAMDYLQKLPVYRNLSEKDQILFLENNYWKLSLFALAFCCHSKGFGQIQYPAGVDLFSKDILFDIYISPNFLQEIRTTLYNKMAKMKISIEEFAILCGYFACDPDIEKISVEGQEQIEKQQDSYETLLMNHLIGLFPSNRIKSTERFCSLISIGASVKQTHADIESVLLLHDMQIWMQENPPKVTNSYSTSTFYLTTPIPSLEVRDRHVE